MLNIEELREILKDNKLHIGIGSILKLHLAKDRSYLKVSLSVFPEEREIIATMTWDSVGPDSGDYDFPSPGDLVLFAQAEGDVDQAFVIKRLSSREDTIPQEATTGDKVHRAKAGKKYWNISDINIYFSRTGTEPTENLVLGQVFKKFAQDLLEILKTQAQNDADHRHIGNLGYLSFVPDLTSDYLDRKTEYNELKESPINDQAILSDLSFTEK